MWVATVPSQQPWMLYGYLNKSIYNLLVWQESYELEGAASETKLTVKQNKKLPQ